MSNQFSSNLNFAIDFSALLYQDPEFLLFSSRRPRWIAVSLVFIKAFRHIYRYISNVLCRWQVC